MQWAMEGQDEDDKKTMKLVATTDNVNNAATHTHTQSHFRNAATAGGSTTGTSPLNDHSSSK